MPCYRCGARQQDPGRGPSPWKRGVRGGEQVLVCPDCQSARDWAGDLDACGRCGSFLLVRRLGETVCRSCSAVDAGLPVVRTPEPAPPASGIDPPPAGGLAGEVAAALERVLGRRTRPGSEE